MPPPPPAPAVASATQSAQPEPIDDVGNGGSFLLFTAIPSWLTSTIIHIIVLLILALLTLPPITRPTQNELVLGEENDIVESLEEFQDQAIDSIEIDTSLASEFQPDDSIVTDDPLVNPFDTPMAPVKIDLDPLGTTTVASNDLGQEIGSLNSTALDSRTSASKARLLREGGGTPGSEAAVALALEWLKRHQLKDGGWSLNHKEAPDCQGRCPDIGTKENARFGATGLALLPFLGAGQTHLEGEHKEVVNRGLQYLLRNIQREGPVGRLVDKGTYYSHGLCSIVLCEAFAMTKDKTLRGAAQALINETVIAQDPIGGGWRYSRQQPGDTSAVGWQLMALKSATWLI